MRKRSTKKVYRKPQVVYAEKAEALAAVCDSAWVPRRTCMLRGQVGCQRTRF